VPSRERHGSGGAATLGARDLKAATVTPSRTLVLRNYLFGIASIVIGAGATSATDSMLPLAMGAAVAVMCTVSLVRAILGGVLRKSRS
jgi:hypothetical protein